MTTFKATQQNPQRIAPSLRLKYETIAAIAAATALTAVALFSCPFVSEVHASPLKPLKQASEVFKNQGLQKKLKSKKIAPQCTNFTGNWKGTCVDLKDGKATEETIVIEQQGCSSLVVAGLEQNINGSLQLNSQPNPNAEDSISMSAIVSHEWNDSQTKLNTLTSFSIFNGGLSAIGTGSMWLSGEQLRTLDTSASPLIGPSGPVEFGGLVQQDCTYDRVPN